MTFLEAIRKGKRGIIAAGNHPAIIQSILDFDYLSGKPPSILGIVTGARKTEKFFFGRKEVLIPCFFGFASIPVTIRKDVFFLLNLQSGRRALSSTVSFFDTFPHALGGHLFAENIPEAHAVELIRRYNGKKWIAGPSGVGFLLAGHLKLGAAGGTDPKQIRQNCLASEGSVAVISTSGGMTNELMSDVVAAGRRISFAACIGGDRFPASSLSDALTLAEGDRHTTGVAYFGELGGEDEYEIVKLMREKKLTKPLVAYIAGIIDETFPEHVQFGHAKALVQRNDESARAKRDALQRAGAIVSETFPEFLHSLAGFPESPHTPAMISEDLSGRRKSILSTRIVLDTEHAPAFVTGKKLVTQKESFAASAVGALLGKPLLSPISRSFAEAVFTLLMDHGGEVSGAVNTMITARAGKDLPSALASGILTIGPRFGGAINEAARQWLSGVSSGKKAADVVEEMTREGKLVAGIGHRKYRVGIPDPRVASLSGFVNLLKKHPHYDFAREIERVTTAKNGKLILNVDGVLAALTLDILSECEKYSAEELSELADAEFFNALFIIPRTVGFSAHFMEQKRNDEGLFRLPEELLFIREVSLVPNSKSKKKH